MLNKFEKKEVRTVITGLLTHACGRCTTPNECNDCPIQETMQAMNKQLINDPDWSKKRHNLTTEAYRSLRAKGKQDREICGMFNMTRHQLYRFKKKEKIISDRLTHEDYLEIRRMRKEGRPYKEIAERFGISRGYASEIARGKKFGEVVEMEEAQ